MINAKETIYNALSGGGAAPQIYWFWNDPVADTWADNREVELGGTASLLRCGECNESRATIGLSSTRLTGE